MLSAALAAAALGLVATMTSAAASSPTATILANWERFFSGSTPAKVKVALLENGTKFASVIDAQASSPLAKSSSVKVLSVHLENKTAAAVRYTIELGGKPALANQSGTALYEANTWKVGDASFCALLALEGTKPPACSTGVVVSTSTNNKLGTILVSGGNTLYSLKPSTTGCTGACTKFWPMLFLPTGVTKATAGKGVAANKLATVTRAHGVRQVTYAGKALYTYVGDKSSGQTNGNGVKDAFGTWSAIVAAKPKTSTSTSTTSSGGYGSY